MDLRVESLEFFERPTRTRLPFHFGAVTMRRATTLIARVRASAEGTACEGYAAELLVPRWFDKDPVRDASDDERNLKRSARAAATAMLEAQRGTVFELWRHTYEARQARAAHFPGGGLAVGFGVALVERALIDAACRAAGLGFREALATDLFGYRPDELHAELSEWDPRASLASPSSGSIAVRHTIGLLDPLLRGDRPPSDRLEDGFPESLEEDVERYGLRRFKIKLGGAPDSDLARLQRLAELLPVFCGPDAPPLERWSVTLDANEQYESLESLGAMLERLARSEAGADLLARLRFVEQPIPRAKSLDPAARDGFAALARFAPCILDEADADLDAFPRAIECGWRGVSVKACKGVFRAWTNRGLCEVRRDAALFQSGEDLTNLPLLPLQQDLCLADSLGLEDVERNGHHYFRGLDHLPPSELAAALEAHPDLYESYGEGATLRIEGGRVSTRSLSCRGFGYEPTIDLSAPLTKPVATEDAH